MPQIPPPPAFFSKLVELAGALLSEAKASRHRRALLLAGDSGWTLQTALCCRPAIAFGDTLWVSTRAPEGTRSIEDSKASKVLGGEVDALIFDAHSGFDPDAFGAVVGCVRGGGLLLLLTPSLSDWPRQSIHDDVGSRYIRRLVRMLRENDDVVLVEQDQEIPNPPALSRCTMPPDTVHQEPYRTNDQYQAVEAIMRVAIGHRRRPLVLTSDRGRGKSSALGIASALLVKRGLRHIIVTAPRLAAVEPLFKHARRMLPGAVAKRGYLRHAAAIIEFMAPDALSVSDRKADLVLVDEAAAMPSALLARLLRHHARIVFASTVHGYEGAGRGFAVRFHQVLDRITPGWRSMRMETPIRWASDDPVERLVFAMLLLDASPIADQALTPVRAQDCVIGRVDRDKLTKDERTLSELFGLLVLAHYQTRPTDLQHLLDGSDIHVFAMRRGNDVVATALVTDEGGLEARLCREIYRGRRRVRGHLIPQTLAAHLGLEKAPGLRGLRVIRIAVHPVLQGRGFGTLMLKYIATHVHNRDFVGSCFGATTDLLHFWKKSGFHTVRLGITRGATSGTHSAMVLKPLTKAGSDLYSGAKARFDAQLPYLLSDPLRELEPELAFVLLQEGTNERSTADLATSDWREIVNFAFANRSYESGILPIGILVKAALSDPRTAQTLAPPDSHVLIAKVLQKKSWQETARLLKLSGRAAVIAALRTAVQRLVRQFAPPSAQREAESLMAFSRSEGHRSSQRTEQ